MYPSPSANLRQCASAIPVAEAGRTNQNHDYEAIEKQLRSTRLILLRRPISTMDGVALVREYYFSPAKEAGASSAYQLKN
jgi:hypothetical protein